MKITYQWLRQYVEVPWTPEQLAERLTLLGLEVEGVEHRAGEFEGVVVAQVMARDKHPNADKLSVCRVNDGKGERQIVCGAQNFNAGDKVPLVLPGATLPTKSGEAPFTIKVGKIRGVESHGMMCSAAELGLPGGADGLLVLSPDASVGQPFAEHLGKAGSDVIYDLEVTPNRPDLNSVLGIAREVAALTGNPLRMPDVVRVRPDTSSPQTQTESGSASALELVRVRVESPELCPRYTARVIRGVKVGPSPEWLRALLEKLGVRSVNNVVDVTNYVMLETGQPLHAFDFRRVGGAGGGIPAIVVRRASEGERFVTLDGQSRLLTQDMLLIADQTEGIALAGLMGGKNSEIQEDTTDVLLESACFNPSNIRRTSKLLGLRTDASYRFERGADVGVCDWASQRAVGLILESAGRATVSGVVDAYPGERALTTVSLRHGATGKLLGMDIPLDRQRAMLSSLGFEAEPGNGAEAESLTTFRVPSFRVDIKREVDLVEEIARLFGVDKIPSTPPRGCVGFHGFDSVHDQLMEVRALLSGAGLSEAQGQTLIRGSAAALSVGADKVAPLANPLSAEMDVLRPSLLPGLLDSLRHNSSRKNVDVGLFEIGKVFPLSEGGVKEGRRLAVAMTGARAPLFWSGMDRGALCDAADLKGVLEDFFEIFGLKGLVYLPRSEATALFQESAVVALGGKLVLGEMGLVRPMLSRSYDLRSPVLMAEFDLDLLLARRNAAKSFKPLPLFPSVRRDAALVVGESVSHDSVMQAVRQARAAALESVELFDVFRGKGVVEGTKSVAYSFTYRHADRTLTDTEVNSAHETLIAHLVKQLQATVR